MLSCILNYTFTLRRAREYKKACDIQYILHLSIIISSNDIDISMKKYNEENIIKCPSLPMGKIRISKSIQHTINFKFYILIDALWD